MSEKQSGAEKAGRSASALRLDRILYASAFVLLAAALAFSEWSRAQQTAQSARLKGDLEIARSEAGAALEATIPGDVLSDADRSVYMIFDDNGYFGTAFVIDRERGILATAAHVASILPLDGETSSVRVINRYSRKALPVKGRRVHAAYGAFRKLVEAWRPFDPASSLADPRAVALHDYVGDAAVLFVDPIDAESGENILGPALPIAGERALRAIKPGDPIAVLGFPSDVVTSEIMTVSASSRVERGVVAALIGPIDIAEEDGDPVTRNLIVHRMAIAPGSSGGPVVNRLGEVVGITSHGYDSPASNGDSIAQRAEILYDLTSPFREEEQLERLYKTDWRRRLSRWLKGDLVVPYIHYAAHADGLPNGFAKRALSTIDFEAAAPFTNVSSTLYFSPRRRSFALLATDLARQGAASAPADTGEIAAQPTPAFVIARTGQYAEQTFEVDPARESVIYAFNYTTALNIGGVCETAIFARPLGAQTMRLGEVEYFPSMRFAPDPARKEPYLVQAIFYRPACTGAGAQILAGMVSWKDGEGAPALKPQSARPPSIAHARQTAARAIDAARCRLAGEGCLETISAVYGEEAARAAHEAAAERPAPAAANAPSR